MQQLLDELRGKTDELIGVKTIITKANQSVQGKIYRLSELKSLIAFYKTIPSLEGKETASRLYSKSMVEYESQVKEPELDKLIAAAEAELEALQDELDAFNHTADVS